jgi:hypothetical protein
MGWLVKKWFYVATTSSRLGFDDTRETDYYAAHITITILGIKVVDMRCGQWWPDERHAQCEVLSLQQKGI